MPLGVVEHLHASGTERGQRIRFARLYLLEDMGLAVAFYGSVSQGSPTCLWLSW